MSDNLNRCRLGKETITNSAHRKGCDELYA